jgi:hypothetical protein
MSYNAIGKVWTAESFEQYLKSISKPAWCNAICLHHTALPSLQMRPKGLLMQHIHNMKDGYVQKGWKSGPHLYIDEDQIYAMSPLTEKGVHAVSFNSNSIGMVNIVIGNGTPTFGSFVSITWSNGIAYEVYVNSNLVGTKQVFLSVPYALYSTPPKLTLTSGTILSSGPLTNSVTLPNPGASTTITPLPLGNLVVNGIAPSYTISSPNYTLTNPVGTNNIQLSNGSNVSIVTLPSQTLGISSGILNVGANSINLSNTTDGFWGLKGNIGNNSCL